MLPVIVGGWGPLDFATRAATSHKRGVISVDTFWDIGMGDQTAIWFHQHDGLRHRLIDYHSNSGESLPHYAVIRKRFGDAWLQLCGTLWAARFRGAGLEFRNGKAACVEIAEDLAIVFAG
jgi:hypothetical protein